MKAALLSLALPMTVLFFACQSEQKSTESVHSSNLKYVGRDSCVVCHQQQADLYHGSDHDLAMELAADSTVLGDFTNARFKYFGETTSFYKKDGQFFVRTANAVDEQQEFKVHYTFGHRPLQQYLVEFPNGAYQMLPFCWDTRPAAEGGQRWFHIYGDEHIKPDDILHWTHITQTWNYMCAECHSTNLQKNYNPETETYHTSWSEIDVSCEACHGAGSEHLAWARAQEKGHAYATELYLGLSVRLTDADQATWIFESDTSKTATRTLPQDNENLLNICGRCHAHRTQIHPDFEHGASLLQSHQPSVLEEPLYFSDGQIREEVYVYGSFTQSKMFENGVVCKDCHEPHSGKIYVQGNALCYRCHAPQEYGVRAHHFHDPAQDGALCVECHMPERTYMQVDPRRDHRLHSPRPGLSAKLGTPDACVKCHSEQTVQWAARWTSEWYGESAVEHYGEVFYQARRAWPGVETDLVELANAEQPLMVRATALHYLGNYPTPESAAALRQALTSPEPLLRTRAVMAAGMVPESQRPQLLAPMFSDSVRSVRSQAAFQCVGLNAAGLSRTQRQAFETATNEYLAIQEFNADHYASHLNLGNYYLRLQNFDKAETAYLRAIDMEPAFAHSYINLADLYRMQNRDDEGEALLQRAVEYNPDLPEVHFSLGLLYIRRKKLDAAINELKLASEQAPRDAHFAYVYALALHSQGDFEKAVSVLKSALEHRPADREALYALATFHRDVGDINKAMQYAQKLTNFYPGIAQYQQLLASLK